MASIVIPHCRGRCWKRLKKAGKARNKSEIKGLRKRRPLRLVGWREVFDFVNAFKSRCWTVDFDTPLVPAQIGEAHFGVSQPGRNAEICAPKSSLVCNASRRIAVRQSGSAT